MERKIKQNVFRLPFTRDEIFTIMHLIADYNDMKTREGSEENLNKMDRETITNRFGAYFTALLQDDPKSLEIAKQLHN